MSGEWKEAKLAIARLVAPLGIWMAAGWAAYPYAMEFIVERSGDEVDIAEIRSFCVAAAVACVAAAAVAGAYCAMAKDASAALAPPQKRCPYCGEDNPAEADTCALCDRPMAK
jgi:hypothetical protein